MGTSRSAADWPTHRCPSDFVPQLGGYCYGVGDMCSQKEAIVYKVGCCDNLLHLNVHEYISSTLVATTDYKHVT